LIHEKQMNTHIIMTSSVDRSYYAPLIEQGEIDYCIQKPFVSLDIMKPIRVLMGFKSDTKIPYVDDSDFLKHKSSKKFRILLVEDTEINQEVAVQMLSMLGHDVSVAQNGNEALVKMESHHFDVIMMDIQMPGMDGIETTKIIRDQEKESGIHIPIIAMTAHAMKGDRERFLTAGMDGYISKPVNPATLYDVLEFDSKEKLNDISVDVMNKEFQNPQKPVFVNENVTIDWQALLDKFEGDEAFLHRVVTVFLKEIPKQLDSIDSALSNENFQDLTNHSHTFKGAISNFDSGSVYQAALDIEMMSRAKDINGAKEAFITLRENTGILKNLLNQKMK